MLLNAKKEHKAIFHFNINNLEWTKWILEKCDELSEPVILGVSESAVSYMGGYEVVVSLVKSLINNLNIKIDVCLHLDHGKTIDSCKKAIDAGFTSVMIDLSTLKIEDNIKGTNELKNYAKNKDVSVEAELGSMGSINDGNLSLGNNSSVLDCLKFVKETNVDSLAVSVGTIHGLYKGKLDIDYNLISEISSSIDIPLVLHGGSGLSNSILKKCVEAGITKININSDLQYAWSMAVRNYLNINNNIIDPRKIINSGMNVFKEEIEKKYSINKQ